MRPLNIWNLKTGYFIENLSEVLLLLLQKYMTTHVHTHTCLRQQPATTLLVFLTCLSGNKYLNYFSYILASVCVWELLKL